MRPDDSLEQATRKRGYALVCGCDEAGAGPLMGPVCAGAVILPEGCDIPGLDDSKKLTEKKREALYGIITERAIAWAVASVSAAQIDATDILSARIKAMELAIEALSLSPDYALIDGNRDHGKTAAITLPHETVVGGDGRSVSIAAASILAKVTRDRYVTQVLDREYPQYLFAQHKGYGTKLHYAMLDQYGPCPEHRQSFLKKWKERQPGRGHLGRGGGGQLSAPPGLHPAGPRVSLPVRGDRPDRPKGRRAVLRGGQDPDESVLRPAPGVCDPKKAGAAAENGGLVPDGEGPGLPRPLRRGGGVRRGSTSPKGQPHRVH